jgi:hypothetical protein
MMADMIKALLPPGKYFLGDICYVLSKEDYKQLIEKIAWTENKDKCLSHKLEIDGKRIIFSPTAYGDGMYKDNKGNKYPVDSGIIAIVPYELCKVEEFKKDIDSSVYDFESEVLFMVKQGKFTMEGKLINKPYPIKIVIDTNYNHLSTF